MSNHLHVVLKTPEPSLARGMQGFCRPMPTSGLGAIALMAMSFRGVIARSWWKTNRIYGRSHATCISIRCPGPDRRASWHLAVVELSRVTRGTAALSIGWLTMSCWRPGLENSVAAVLSRRLLTGDMSRRDCPSRLSPRGPRRTTAGFSAVKSSSTVSSRWSAVIPAQARRQPNVILKFMRLSRDQVG